MVLNEAIDNEFGMKKDDMTVIVAKINKKQYQKRQKSCNYI